ncbi:MAG: CinA family protein [Nitrospirae bacterium]|nr:CinA family protein [Nitrospirota bacterium]
MKQEILEAVLKVHELFKSRSLTLSVAESCTGGLISHYITSLPGASVFFRAGIVSYSEEAKKIFLGVSLRTIIDFGIVSEKTAREMAERARMIAKTDFSISTTGNLGPEVLEEKEKGLVYIAVSGRGKTVSRELKLKGDRDANKEESALEALRLLIETAEEK